MHVHALHRDAGLACVAEAAEDDPLQRVVDVCVLVHDHGGVAAELERHALASGARLQPPADRRAARECEQLDPVVLDERARVVGRARHDGEAASRPAGLVDQLGELERADRRLRRGSQHDRVSRGERGRDLVRHEIEGEVERRDAGDRAERHAAHVRDAAVVPGDPVERHDLPVDPLRLLGGDRERECGAVDFDARGADRLSRLERDRARKFVAARGHAGADLLQDLRALPRRQAARRLERVDRSCDR